MCPKNRLALQLGGRGLLSRAVGPGSSGTLTPPLLLLWEGALGRCSGWVSSVWVLWEGDLGG